MFSYLVRCGVYLNEIDVGVGHDLCTYAYARLIVCDEIFVCEKSLMFDLHCYIMEDCMYLLRSFFLKFWFV